MILRNEYLYHRSLDRFAYYARMRDSSDVTWVVAAEARHLLGIICGGPLCAILWMIKHEIYGAVFELRLWLFALILRQFDRRGTFVVGRDGVRHARWCPQTGSTEADMCVEMSLPGWMHSLIGAQPEYDRPSAEA